MAWQLVVRSQQVLSGASVWYTRLRHTVSLIIIPKNLSKEMQYEAYIEMPKGRVLPFPLGMWTRLDGNAW